MKQRNPFPYSDDNKRYLTWNYYLKQRYHKKVYKVPLNAGFTCPNRDGNAGTGGCTFCSSLGSGDYAGDVRDDLYKQFHEGKQMMERKWPNGLAIAYFQAFSNTYAPLQQLKEIYEPFRHNDEIISVAIATRSDCLTVEIMDYLAEYNKDKELWIELGLQSIHNQTADVINRGHSFENFKEAVDELRKRNINVVVHLMNSLPNETKEMMIESARVVGQLDIQAIKIHMLHVTKQTIMGYQYSKQPFPLQSKEEYIDTIASQLEVLPPTVIIQRLTGDAPKDALIAPLWTLKKTIVLNDIDKKMVERNTYQGKLYQ